MNGIYLFLLLKEIKDELINLYIDDIERLDRIIQIVCGEKALFVSLYPEAPAIFLASRIKQGFEQLKLFTTELRSSRILDIRQLDFKPVVNFDLEKASLPGKTNPEVTISLYREAPNFAIGPKKLFSRLIEKTPKRSILELTDQELRSTLNQEKKSAVEYLVKEFEGIDKYLAGELTIENLKKLQSVLSGLKVKPRLVSAKPLRISFFAKAYMKEYPSLNTLLEDGLKTFTKTKADVREKSRKKELIKNMKKRIERLKKELLKEEEIEQYRIVGELILANISKIKRGTETLNLFNPYIQKEVEIILDPIKIPQENAQAYFTRYKKLKRGQPKIRDKIKSLEKKIEGITKQIPEITEAAPFTKPTIKKEKPAPFRSYALPSGSVVYVGKNAKSNAELTFNFAQPNDYFFHVRGYEGAHTILKAQIPKGQKPRKDDIEGAAAIAAYFSKAKTQKKVPISYTQRKYLKKNKKGKPGSVILMREEVIFIEPQLPEVSNGV